MRPLLAAALALASTTTAAAADIAVLNLEAGMGIDPRLADLVTTGLVAEVQRVSDMQVISSKDIEVALGFEQQRQTFGCANDACFAELGGALGVSFLVAGSLNRVGDSLVLSAQLYDTKRVMVHARHQERIKGGEEALLDAVVPTARALFARELPWRESRSGSNSSVSTRSVAGIVALGVGVAAGIGGVVTGLQASARMDEAAAAPQTEYQAIADGARSSGYVADGLYGVALIGVALGGWLLIGGGHDAKVAVAPIGTHGLAIAASGSY